jgi:hypothetical protein
MVLHMARVHLVLDDAEHHVFREAAGREGLTLSQWLREAARARLQHRGVPRLATRADLERLFAELDEGRGEPPGATGAA